MLLPEFVPALAVQDVKRNAGMVDDYLSPSFIAQRLEAGSDNLHAETIATAESRLFRQVLAHTSGNQLKAAGILGISRVSLQMAK